MRSHRARPSRPLLAMSLLALTFSACGSPDGAQDTPGDPAETALPADAVTVGNLTVHSVRIPVPISGDQASVYGEIVNGGDAETLVSMSSERAGTGSLHRMLHEGGLVSMEPVGSLPVPAAGRLSLSPGERHGMLQGLDGPWAVGDRVPVVFRFGSGAEIRVMAPVVAALDAVHAH